MEKTEKIYEVDILWMDGVVDTCAVKFYTVVKDGAVPHIYMQHFDGKETFIPLHNIRMLSTKVMRE